MPKLDFAGGDTSSYQPPPGEFLSSTYGVETTIDALNYGMRFTGHRWLHDVHSFARMAEICGFTATPTDCATSSEPRFNELNSRTETDSPSFAHDLRKSGSVSRLIVAPATVDGAEKVEDLPMNAALYRATAQRPIVEYVLAQTVDADRVACINFRSSNLSCFDWGVKTLVFGSYAKVWQFDETMKSQPGMNIITRSQVKVTVGEGQAFSTLRFSPALNPGEYFSLGRAEVYLLTF